MDLLWHRRDPDPGLSDYASGTSLLLPGQHHVRRQWGWWRRRRRRIWRGRWTIRRWRSERIMVTIDKDRIKQAIQKAERRTSGEIRVSRSEERRVGKEC